MEFWLLPEDRCYLRIERNGLNTPIGKSILKTFYPDNYTKLNVPVEKRENFLNFIKIADGKNIFKCDAPGTYPWYLNYKIEGSENIYSFNTIRSPHRYMPSSTTPSKKIFALIRNPVDRLLSFINKYTPEFYSKDQEINVQEKTNQTLDEIFKTAKTDYFLYNGRNLIVPQVTYINEYKNQINFYKYPEHNNDIIKDIGILPVEKNNIYTRYKTASFTAEQIAAVEQYYSDDLALFNSIEYPGIMFS